MSDKTSGENYFFDTHFMQFRRAISRFLIFRKLCRVHIPQSQLPVAIHCIFSPKAQFFREMDFSSQAQWNFNSLFPHRRARFRLRRLDQFRESFRLVDREFGQIFAIHDDFRFRQSVDETGISHPGGADSGVQSLNPQRAESSFF